MNWLCRYQLLLFLKFINSISTLNENVLTIDVNTKKLPTLEVPRPLSPLDFDKLDLSYMRARKLNLKVRKTASTRKPSLIDVALQVAAKEGLDAMANLYRNIEPEIARKGQLLADNHPAALLSKFSAPAEGSEQSAMAAYATIAATKAFRRNCKESTVLGRGAQSQKVSFRRTPLEGLCPPREPPKCMPAAQRYRTHDGTCNNRRRPRWGSAQMPFNRFLPPEYGDGVDSIRGSVEGGPLSSARFVSLLVHGAREGDASLTLMIAQWGQLLDHDMTSTAQPRSINGSVPSCCGSKDFHPSCFPIKVPLDDPWLAPLKVRCLEFLRSAPAQRRDCVLSWREQTNQVTSFIDASPIYSSNAKMSDNARTFRNGLLVYGRGNPADDVCMRGALAHQCIRSGDGRSGEQPGLLALHHVLVGEHNRIAMELSNLNPHWSDEKVYQETRRIIVALFQHITYREFLPIVLGREVCKLFDIELLNSGFYTGYDPNTNPSVSNAFAAAAFRFGHSLVQNSYMRCDRHHNFINNNVTLHEEFQQGDIGTAGSLHRLIRGLAAQKALKRDEFITPELTNHLFQTPGFPFGLDLAAINIQRGRDHGVAPYTSWRQPCGLSPITTWDDLANVVGPESAKRISHAYRNVHDIDLFVGGIAERPVIGGLVGPTFACIIAQQFSNSRKGDRFWYENPGFESSFTPAQLHSIRHINLASILCRAVGGGTFQPHVFIPSDIPDNQRVECGKGHLAPLDLRPWLEQDPFTVTNEKKDTPVSSPISHESPKPVELPIQVTKEEKGINNRIHNITMVAHVDFIPNGAIGFHRVPNMTKIHDKLDIAQKIATRPIQKPFQGISNKLDKGRLSLKKLPKPNTTTRRTVVIHNIEIELRSAASKAQKNKKKKTDKEIQRELMDSAAQNTILRVAGVVKSQMNAVIGALEPRNGKEGILAETTTLQPIYDQTTDTQIDLDTVKEILDKTDSPNLLTEPPLETTTDTLTKHSTLKQTKLSASPPTDISTQTHQKYEAFQLKIDTALHNQTDRHKRVHRSPRYLNFKVQGVEFSTHLDFADKLRTLQLDKTNTFTGRHLSSDQFDYPFEAGSNDQNDTDTKNSTNSDSSLQNETNILTRANNRTPAYAGGIRKIELRKYQERPIYNRPGPQKVILDGPNSDQYEIEINIRQTNTKAPPLNDNYIDYSNPNKHFELDRHDYDYPHTQATSSQNYYTQTTRAPLVTRTKPPTVIYINEHDERPTTTIRPPGFFQNLFSLATNGFNNHNKPTESSNSPFHHTPNRVETSGSGPEVEHLSPLSSPSSKPSSASYFNSPQNHPFSQSKPTSGSYLSGQQVQPYPPQNFPQNGPSSFGPVNGLPPPHSFSPPQALPPPHPFQPPNVFPFPALPGANSFSTVSNVGGVSHASSSAVSTGHFGTIVGSAASSGSDSTFSFNIRPSARPQPNLVSPTGIRPNYERFPQRQSYISSTPSYAIPPKPISTVESLHYPPNRHDHPFSGHTRRPPFQNERPTNVFDPAYEDFGRSELKIYENGNIEGKTNGTKTESSEYDYVDEDDDYETSDNADETENDADETEPAKKFDTDGYLRPEHMAANLFKQTLVNKTKINATGFNDNFVLPVLIQNNQFNNAQTKANDSVRSTNATFYPDIEQKSIHNDILAEHYDELLTSQTLFLTDRGEKRRRPAINLQVAFAPIKVLTKPERPDNWVIFDTEEEKPLLPVLPEMNSETLVAAEVPMPFGVGSVSTTNVPLTNKLTVPNKTLTDQNIKEQITTTNYENTTTHDGRTDLPATSTDATTNDTTDATTFVTEQMFNNDIDSIFDNYSENVDEDNFYLTTTEDISNTTDLVTEMTTNPDERTEISTNEKTEEQNRAINQPTTELSTEQMTEESTTKNSSTQRTELVTNDLTNQFQNLQTEVNLT